MAEKRDPPPPPAPEGQVEPAEPEPADPEERAQADLVRRAGERDQFFGQCQRLQAEIENQIKRHRRDREEWQARTVQGILAELLPVLDSLRSAIEGADGAGSPPSQAALLEGLTNLERQLLAVLARQGVVPFDDGVGQPFDPARHEALFAIEAPEPPDHTVLRLLKPGYKLGERVLRAAQVVVSRRGSPVPPAQEEPTHADV